MEATLPFEINTIFNIRHPDFTSIALQVFHYQKENNALYGSYVKNKVTQNDLTSIPFLPISFFKTHKIITGNHPVEKIFSSSGTGLNLVSQHSVCSVEVYEKSFLSSFYLFYGDPAQYAVLCLLPGYLERQGSSLIYMAEHLVQLSQNSDSGFFLDSEGNLLEILKRRESEGKKSLLLGVSFALLDFSEKNAIPLRHTIIMETGGMKGRRAELTRMELHSLLKQAFSVNAIHSEYGMTELLSQAYSTGEGRYNCPPWMRVFVRDEDDPFDVKETGTGILCIIDLANLYSCSFIETADVGKVFSDGSFEVLGRLDNSDLRGCSLLVVE